MPPYEELQPLRHLYLVDSWILGISLTPRRFAAEVDFVLVEAHPDYHPPRTDEKYY